MARKFLDFDPTTGLLTTSTQEDGKTYIGYQQDVQAHLDIAARCRNERDPNFDRKDVMRHVAFVPDIVQIRMLAEDGVRFHDPNDEQKVLQLLETKYKLCKTTDKRIA